jgi:hypothetical protein
VISDPRRVWNQTCERGEICDDRRREATGETGSKKNRLFHPCVLGLAPQAKLVISMRNLRFGDVQRKAAGLKQDPLKVSRSVDATEANTAVFAIDFSVTEDAMQRCSLYFRMGTVFVVSHFFNPPYAEFLGGPMFKVAPLTPRGVGEAVIAALDGSKEGIKPPADIESLHRRLFTISSASNDGPTCYAKQPTPTPNGSRIRSRSRAIRLEAIGSWLMERPSQRQVRMPRRWAARRSRRSRRRMWCEPTARK